MSAALNNGTRPSRPARRRSTLGVSFTLEPGEAAFYGPKIDFVIKDVIGANGSSARFRSITNFRCASTELHRLR